MTNIYQEIIKVETLYFRGISLGASIPDVEILEGNNYKRRTGSNPSLHFKREIGEIEEFDLYFGLDKDDKVNRIKLILYSYPSYYHNQKTGGSLGDFTRLVNENNIKEFSLLPNTLIEEIVNMFTNKIGEPSIEDKDEIFKKNYQNFKRWIWVNDYNGFPLRLSLTRYLDDSDFNNIRWVISLLLVKDDLIYPFP